MAYKVYRVIEWLVINRKCVKHCDLFVYESKPIFPSNKLLFIIGKCTLYT